MRRVFDLQLFPDRLVERLVVGHFLDQRADRGAEVFLQLGGRGVGILDGVVEERGGENIDIGNAGIRERCGHCNWVIDVRRGLGILSTLGPVFFRGEACGGEKQPRAGQGQFV